MVAAYEFAALRFLVARCGLQRPSGCKTLALTGFETRVCLRSLFIPRSSAKRSPHIAHRKAPWGCRRAAHFACSLSTAAQMPAIPIETWEERQQREQRIRDAFILQEAADRAGKPRKRWKGRKYKCLGCKPDDPPKDLRCYYPRFCNFCLAGTSQRLLYSHITQNGLRSQYIKGLRGLRGILCAQRQIESATRGG